ncbi:MAG: type II secretion system ATPase GspE [Desulfobacteraceae bacterium]|nr:type II secretion system ATPase GspE [Desulfobacteraceae bacterium]
MIDDFLHILSLQNQSLSKENIAKIKAACERDPKGLMEAVLDTRLVLEREILAALGELYGISFVETLGLQNTRDDWTIEISRSFLKKYCITPVAKKSDEPVVIAVHDPTCLHLADEVASLLSLETYSLVLAPKAQILSALNTFYDRAGNSAQQLVEDIEDNGSIIFEDIEKTADLLDDTSDAPVIRLVNHMISQAVKAGASDIHIEPFQDELKVRYRIDGILYEMLTPPKGIQASLVSRVKVMAKMNIAEKRVPQDGRAQVRIGDQEIDIRISTVPTSFGERLVMRLLNKSGYFLEFSEFGLSEKNQALIQEIIRQTNGIVLVTGPTGSGKTTTLYAGLSEINSPDKNIITIEDPVEYNLKGIGQIQVNAKTGVTFARGLRSIVRQDPDIVLVGEIRDVETAEIAIQSALTGHLVFSTLHTNDSAGAITRLVDLGVEPYLISSAVNTIVAQRLIRVLCKRCRQEYIIKPGDIKTMNGAGNEYIGKSVFKPKGCSKCFNTGYSGREAIFEIMIMTDDLKSIILETSDANQIKEESLRQGMITLRQDGMTKVLQGITSIGEVLRVTQE